MWSVRVETGIHCPVWWASFFGPSAPRVLLVIASVNPSTNVDTLVTVSLGTQSVALSFAPYFPLDHTI